VKVRIVPPPPRIIAYHKPVGEVVTHDDPQHRPTVFRRLPRLQQGKWQSVGRLDLNTEGLLLFTNSGELANQLMHPALRRRARVRRARAGHADRGRQGRAARRRDHRRPAASFKSIEDGGGEGANHWYRVVITEGRNREVRKLFDESA
jgi:23S rRNA pseudouridine2605 synthase